MNQKVRLFAFCLALALPVSSAWANPPAAVKSAQDEAGAEEKLKKEWQERYRDLISEIERTRQQIHADKTNYSKAKQRGRLRGGVADELKARVAEYEQRLAELEREFEEFPTTARRAGIPPGWLREVQP
jgi:TolA-binding protein